MKEKPETTFRWAHALGVVLGVIGLLIVLLIALFMIVGNQSKKRMNNYGYAISSEVEAYFEEYAEYPKELSRDLIERATGRREVLMDYTLKGDGYGLSYYDPGTCVLVWDHDIEKFVEDYCS